VIGASQWLTPLR